MANLSRETKQYRDSLNGVCQLCGQLSDETLHLDHDPTTERARGFVCRVCNHHVIVAAELRPKLAHPSVLRYLLNPPLTGHRLTTYRIKNVVSPRICHIANRSMGREFNYREVWKGSKRIAGIKDYPTKISISYDGNQTFADIDAVFVGEDELIALVLRHRP